MKRLFVVWAVASLCQIVAFGQKKYEMVVEKTDGTETAINVEDIVRTYFRERSSSSGGGGDTPATGCPDGNHPHWIDLGLPSGTQWRCCNVDASSPEEYGGYYTFEQAQAYNPPSREQVKELVEKCSYTWTTQNGVNGGKFTGPNGGTIFLPPAGGRWEGSWDGEFYGVGSYGYYWSSTPYDEFNAYGLCFAWDGALWSIFWARHGELSVRPVR